jgi:hypothetical protein
MQATESGRRSGSPAVLGMLLVIVGLAGLGLRQAGVDVGELVGDGGWPFLIIIPGLALLAAAVVPAPPHGLGFAIAGSIVTTVGLILLYQNATGHWESWAYAWALLTAAAGVGTFIYGLAIGRRDLVGNGVRLAAIAGVLFVAGFWFFESIFDSGRAPLDIEAWWPVILVGIGAVITVTAVLRPNRGGEPPATRTSSGGEQP